MSSTMNIAAARAYVHLGNSLIFWDADCDEAEAHDAATSEAMDLIAECAGLPSLPAAVFEAASPEPPWYEWLGDETEWYREPVDDRILF